MNPIAKIGFLIKGQYSDAVTYDFLDVVFYNGASYVAKKLTTGNTPVRSSEYWQIFAEGGTLTSTSDISDTTVAFQQAGERVNIATEESTKTLFGKIKKWLADLKPHAFAEPVNNDLATIPGMAWDAVRGAQIRKDVNEISSNLSNIFITLSGTLPSTTDSSADIVLPYPSGYTRFNTFIVSSIWQNTVIWRERFVNGASVFDASLQGGGITIRLRETMAAGAAFKIILTKQE